MKPALIVIDMLNDFVDGALANPRSKAIIPTIRELCDLAHARGWHVVYSNDAHLPRDPEERVWGPHAMAGSVGAQVIPQLAPAPSDLVVPKRFYSAFHQTGLDTYLRQNDCDTVILTGQHTDICVRHTAADALWGRYDILVPSDAVATFTPEDQQAGLEYLARVYAATILTAEELAAMSTAT